MDQEEGVHQLGGDLETAQESARHRPNREYPVMSGHSITVRHAQNER